MCVILYTDINGKKIFAKNRDRMYKPNIQIIHEIKNGIELVYIKDLGTGWIEGFNENGIAFVNSTLNMKDSKSIKYKKKKKNITQNKKNKIYNALTTNHNSKILYDIIEKPKNTNEILEGNTLISLNNKIYHIENDIYNNFNIRKINKPSVFSNHSKYLHHLGYTKGKKGLSSFFREKLTQKKISYKNRVKNNKEIYEYILNNVLNNCQYNIDPRLHAYRDEMIVRENIPLLNKNTIIMYTTGQLLYNITDKEFVYQYDKNNSKSIKYINKLPKNYIPKIRVTINETEKSRISSNILTNNEIEKYNKKFKYNKLYKIKTKKNIKTKQNKTKQNKTKKLNKKLNN